MSERNYYVICDDNCRFESMTKEQILTAITQAVEQGEIHDVDTGFITTIKEQNAQRELMFWVGTQAQYNAISEPVENMMYLITDPQADAEMQEQINELREDVDAIPTAGALLWNGNAAEGDVITVQNADKYNLFSVVYGSESGSGIWSGLAVRNFDPVYNDIAGNMAYLLDETYEKKEVYYLFRESENNAWTLLVLYDFDNLGTEARIKRIYGIA